MVGLSDDEHRAIELLGEVATIFATRIVSKRVDADRIDDGTRASDLAEFVYHVHNAQRMIAAQAAAREYPKLYRLLGEGPPCGLE